jgi:hypothetical protein
VQGVASACNNISDVEEDLQATENNEKMQLYQLVEQICNEVDMSNFTLRMVSWLTSCITSHKKSYHNSRACMLASVAWLHHVAFNN